jgi:hypothetical protein
MAGPYFCSDEERRAAVADPASGLNGIDYLEVLDSEVPDTELKQRILVLRFFKGGLAGLTAENVRIEGGVRIRPVGVIWALPLQEVAGAPLELVPQAEKDFLALHFAGEPEPETVLIVRTDSNGDYSIYRLSLVTSSADPSAPPGFDPRLAAVDFSFKVECPTDFDCKQEEECPPPELTEPRIDYLAKDYSSFRRLLFDRLNAIAPEWRERSPADFGVALLELMAYLGDQLSYYQDAVATEAYLGTARRRISVRRHARLVDYRLHEGVNARAWIHLRIGPGADGAILPGPDPATGSSGTPISTRADLRDTIQPPSALEAAVQGGAIVFETLHDVTLREALNEIPFHTWTDRECCLPAGATTATLQSDPIPGLAAGSFLLFEEVLGPRTGAVSDADPTHRQVVRLTRADPAVDPLDGTPVIEIEWSAADALSFPLCVSARTDPAQGAEYIENVSVARGNLVLADHGLTIEGETIESAPADVRFYRAGLAEGPVTHAVALPVDFPEEDEPRVAVAELGRYEPRDAVPVVRLESSAGEIWLPQRDLLASGRFATEFVLEPEEEGASLRFGDDQHGKRPAEGTSFIASYRVGNGRAGNAGGGTLNRIYTALVDIVEVRNPLPASGGREPEALEEVRQFAPQAFRIQQRAVTEEDYAEMAERHAEVQKAAATFRWTGSWYTVFVTVDRKRGLEVDSEFEQRIREHLGFYRMAGYDLEVDGPRFVPLELGLHVCVEPGYPRSDVEKAVLEALGCGRRPDGRLGLFHPDRWTFGQPVYLSHIYAAVESVEGVEAVKVEVFQRWGRLPEDELEDGVIPIQRLEIARLDNDPNFQENGLLRLVMGGGR